MSERPAPWIAVVALAACAATALDALLLQRLYGTFTGGFLNPEYLHGGQVALFLAASLLADAAAATLFVAPALLLAGRVRRFGRAQRVFLAAVLCLVPLETAAVVRLDAHRFVGDALGYALGLALPAALAGSLVLAGVAALATGAGLVALRRVPDGRVPAARRRGWVPAALLVLAAPVGLALLGHASEEVQFQVLRKTTARLIAELADGATDFDGDRHGLVRQPVDGAPFDAARYPFAIDWPGNGVDENGIGGDLAARGAFAEDAYPPVAFAHRPDLVLFVLETFRADNLETEVDGRPVAPVLRGLLAAGAVAGPAYSHNGFTVESLTHLFTGALTETVTTSLIDDFAANGYLTACISGEDESFGGIEQLTGMARADYFVDARRDVGERTSLSTSSGSLTVPWTVVVRNVERFLAERGEDPRPVFLYVNLQDCHFPYVHHATERILENDLVPRGGITEANRERVRRTYRNAAANVDRAVGRILAAFGERRGPPATIVVADHGESLFDGGVLGHGVRITPEQTRIPLLVSGLAAECVFPLGLADVRRLVRDALARGPGAPAARTDPGKWVFQFVGPLRRPAYLGAASAGGGTVFTPRTGAYEAWGEPAARPPLADLVTRWEQIVVQRAEGAPR